MSINLPIRSTSTSRKAGDNTVAGRLVVGVDFGTTFSG